MTTRFYDTLLAHVSQWPIVRKEQSIREVRRGRGLSAIWEGYRVYTLMLTDSNTKRILFDSHQAAVFGDLAVPPPEKAQHLLHAPFDQFYMELTEPILFGEPEAQHQDYIRGFLWSSDTALFQTRSDDSRFSAATMTVFLSEGDTGGEQWQLVDRTWKVHLQTGTPFVSVAAAGADPDPSEVGDYARDQFFLAGSSLGIENRHIGWWERLVTQYTELWSWMMLYCMAKGIYITQESLSRQQRRWLERHPEAPQPWHLVKVEPKITAAHAQGEGFTHSYRYDVIGHLRFANVRVVEKVEEDGTKTYGHKAMVEWVSPHQRGLANTLYIPKTYQVEGGKRIHPAFKELLNA